MICYNFTKKHSKTQQKSTANAASTGSLSSEKFAIEPG